MRESSLEKINELCMEVLAIHAENFWQIGVIRPSNLSMFELVRNNFRNVPDPDVGDYAITISSQYFIKK